MRFWGLNFWGVWGFHRCISAIFWQFSGNMKNPRWYLRFWYILEKRPDPTQLKSKKVGIFIQRFVIIGVAVLGIRDLLGPETRRVQNSNPCWHDHKNRRFLGIDCFWQKQQMFPETDQSQKPYGPQVATVSSSSPRRTQIDCQNHTWGAVTIKSSKNWQNKSRWGLRNY